MRLPYFAIEVAAVNDAGEAVGSAAVGENFPENLVMSPLHYAFPSSCWSWVSACSVRLRR